MGQVQNEEHLCLIAVIGVERPDKATVEREFRERQSGDSGAWTVRGRQPERTQRVNAETTERVDVPRTCRVRTCLSLYSEINKSPESPRANHVRFLPSYERCYTHDKHFLTYRKAHLTWLNVKNSDKKPRFFIL